jgi:phage terminase large subunit-like protein
LYLAGRGAGKTRTAAEWLAWESIRNPKTRWAVVAATFGDVRDTCAEGESGIINILRRYGVLQHYNRSMGEIRLTNGSLIKMFSAAEPDRLRGPQFHGAWCDELAAWQYPETWDQLQFGLRLGTKPRTIVTTTPQPTKLIKELIKREDGSVRLVRGSTFDNAKNLAPSALAQLRARYEGTRLGRQELYAEVLDDTPGALWTLNMIESCRVKELPDMARVVVAIDPAATSNEMSDETGIVVVGKGVDGRGYVLADRTCRLTPAGWARRAIDAFDEFQASRIVGETNMGGDMIETIIHQIRPTVPYRGVVARRGKILRAEPVSSLYEQGRVSHWGVFPELEEQMTTWVSDSGAPSPDRMDALVHAIASLNIGNEAFADQYFNAIAPPCPSCDMPNSPDAVSCFSCGRALQ